MNEVHTQNFATIVIIGASGFIGEHLLRSLGRRNGIQLRVLVHRNRAKGNDSIKFVEGDLLEADSLDLLLSENCTVINLAYLAQNNRAAMTNLAIACVRNRVGRLIHCSTAVVDGRSENDWVTEDTPCITTSEYERTKLEIESILLDEAKGKFEITILRPTAVFGSAGKNLLKLANELASGNPCLNYVRSCLFNRRSMNLVAVENVVAAFEFLIDAEKVDREIFIISDDDSPENNYRYVEDALLKRFGKSYFVPRLAMPKFLLSLLLRLAGKPNLNPSKKYSGRKLADIGFRKPQNLEMALDNFTAWYITTMVNKEV